MKGFRGYEWRDHTLLERSCFSDKKIERDVWDKYEESIGFANRIITQYIKLQNEEKEVLKLIDKLIYEFSQRCNWFDSILYKRNLLKLKNRIADGQYD